jgi:hypothetical protein
MLAEHNADIFQIGVQRLFQFVEGHMSSLSVVPSQHRGRGDEAMFAQRRGQALAIMGQTAATVPPCGPSPRAAVTALPGRSGEHLRRTGLSSPTGGAAPSFNRKKAADRQRWSSNGSEEEQ